MSDTPTELRALAERIARLEARSEAHAASQAREATEAQAEREFAEKHFLRLEHELGAIRTELARYRGAIGAVLIVGSAVITFFKLFWADITRMFR